MSAQTNSISVTLRPAPAPARICLDYLPLVVGPAAAWSTRHAMPSWIAMWCMAFAVYFGLKWLVGRRTRPAPVGQTPRRFAAWFFLWPGMNPAPFFADGSAGRRTTDPVADGSAGRRKSTVADHSAGRRSGKPAAPVPAVRSALTSSRREWLVAGAKTVAGLALVGLIAPRMLSFSSFIAGWIGMVGLILLLHSGSFHLAALAWKRAGVAVEPLMADPLRASSLADFWGRRWNRAFRDLVDPLVFRPLVGRFGPRLASWGVFLFSGLVHDLVITVPAGGGYGLPTLYFLLQAAVIELTHSPIGKRWRLRTGFRARVLAAVTLIVPLGLLAPRPFVENCIVPMVRLFEP
jgi:hypothetical protein